MAILPCQARERLIAPPGGHPCHERQLVPDSSRRLVDRYRTLFDCMDEGFCIIESLDGPHGPLSD